MKAGAMAVLLLLAACGATPGPPGAVVMTPAQVVAQAKNAKTPASGALSTTYVIGPGDQLGISVYRAPELSVPNLPVRPDGKISMPLVPDIVAAGKTPTELGREIANKLKAYVNDPIVTVMVTGFVGPFSRQVRVIGEATQPEAIPYRQHMSLLDVMIAVKGLTKYAAGNQAVIVRKVGKRNEVIKVHLNDLLNHGDTSQNVEMLPGDTLIIPQSWF